MAMAARCVCFLSQTRTRSRYMRARVEHAHASFKISHLLFGILSFFHLCLSTLACVSLFLLHSLTFFSSLSLFSRLAHLYICWTPFFMTQSIFDCTNLQIAEQNPMSTQQPATCQRSDPATAIQQSLTKIASPQSQGGSSLRSSTTLLFQCFGPLHGRMRLSLQNISDIPLHFKFKKAVGTKIEIQPHSTGIIDRKGNKEVQITWRLPESPQANGNPIYAKMILLLSTDDAFSNSFTRLVGLYTSEKWNESGEPQVLIVDAPANAVTARQNLIATAKSASSTTVFNELEQLERQQFGRYLLYYFMFLIFLGLVVHIYRSSNQQQIQRTQDVPK